MESDYEVMMSIWTKAQGSIKVEKNNKGKIVFLNREVQIQFDQEGKYVITQPIQSWEDTDFSYEK